MISGQPASLKSVWGVSLLTWGRVSLSRFTGGVTYDIALLSLVDNDQVWSFFLLPLYQNGICRMPCLSSWTKQKGLLMCQEDLNTLSREQKGLHSLLYLARDPFPFFSLSQLGRLTWHLRLETRQKIALSFLLLGSKSQTKVMSTSSRCVRVKNLMLKCQSFEKTSLRRGDVEAMELIAGPPGVTST